MLRKPAPQPRWLSLVSDRPAPGVGAGGRYWPLLFALTTFLSAFLLFQVQPIIGQLILPWFGGGAAIWITTLLFFQLALLVGYVYAHLIVVRLPRRGQALLHATLVVAAALVLPILPSEALEPASNSDPALRILLVLAITVGPPYLLLSTTGPLLQRWFADLLPFRSPYPLYALSNVGSLLALLSYPVLIEPVLGLNAQAWLWSGAYLAFAALTVAISLRASRTTQAPSELATEPSEAPALRSGPGVPDGQITLARVVLWVALAACATALLMAATTAITLDLAAFPLLWVIPLAIYLLTFILAFASDRLFDPVLALLFLAGACVYAVFLADNPAQSIGWLLILHSVVLFAACFALHGELARLRPRAERLTSFYLAIAAGGALGGLLVAVVAPLVFTDYWEYQVATVATAVVVIAARTREVASFGGTPMRRARLPLAFAALGIVMLAGTMWVRTHEPQDNVIARERNFYGVVEVYFAPASHHLGDRTVMRHGRIMHGFQLHDPELARAPSAYYSQQSGVGLAIEHQRMSLQRPMRVGVIGLGTGMLSAYAEAGDEWTYLEIDPQVASLAEAHFTYLADARARGAPQTVLFGDGRLLLYDQLRTSEGGQTDEGGAQFDLLVLDAFASGAIPTHLLTREAFETYRAHLAPNGIIAAHITNRHIELTRVLRGVADELELAAHLVEDHQALAVGAHPTEWVLLTEDIAMLDQAGIASRFSDWFEDEEPLLWTDDKSSLWPLIRPF